MDTNEAQRVRGNIARVLSEILSDKYDAKITISFESEKGEERNSEVHG